MTIATTFEFPAAFEEAISQDLGPMALSRWTLESLVLTAVGENRLSTGKAAEILGVGYYEVLALLKERGVPVKISAEEVEQDLAEMRKFFSSSGRS